MKKLFTTIGALSTFLAMAQHSFERNQLYYRQLAVHNHGQNQLKLSDFKGKYVILDFWGFRCTSCLQGFPKVDSLQQQFGEDIQIVLVNRENAEATDSFFRSRKKVTKPRVPMITSDSLLFRTFQVTGMPVNIYLDKEGKVMYEISGTHQLTKANLDLIRQGKAVELEKRITKKYVKSIVTHEYQSFVERFSCLSRANISHEFLSSSEFDDGVAIIQTHLSLPMLYQRAYGRLKRDMEIFGRPGRTIALYADTADLHYPDPTEYGDWLSTYGYDYQLYWRKGDQKEAYQKMIKDLDEVSGLQVSVEKRKVNCLVLKPLKNIGLLRTKGGEPLHNLINKGLKANLEDTLYALRNVPFADFIGNIKNSLEFYYAPFIDETGFKGNIDFEIPAEIFERFHLPDIQAHLRKYGLLLTFEKRIAEVMVIRKKKGA